LLSELRPVGNRINLDTKPFDSALLTRFSFIGFNSGTEALAACLESIKKANPKVNNPNVILPAYTCPDVISACIFAGVNPILIDLDEKTCWMSLVELASKLNKNCIAIIAINFMGIPERIDLIRGAVIDFYKNNAENQIPKISIIEDSAQGFPISDLENYWKGDIIITSFGRGKPLNLLGGGGILFKPENSNQKVTECLKQLEYPNLKQTTYGLVLYLVKAMLFNLMSGSFFYYFLSRLSFLKLGETKFYPLDKINKIPSFIENQFNNNYRIYKNRPSLRKDYDQLISELKSPLIISLPIQSKLPIEYPLLRYPILVKDKNLRNELFEKLSDKGLGVSKMYQNILPNIKGINASMFQEVGEYPNSKNLAVQLLTLPMHEDVTEIHLQKISQIIKEFNNNVGHPSG